MALRGLAKSGEKITQLSKSDCKGVPTHFLMFIDKAFKSALDDMLGDDGVHINKVSESFGVTNVTTKTWLRENNLPGPIPKQDQERVYIPYDVFNKLSDIKDKE